MILYTCISWQAILRTGDQHLTWILTLSLQWFLRPQFYGNLEEGKIIVCWCLPVFFGIKCRSIFVLWMFSLSFASHMIEVEGLDWFFTLGLNLTMHNGYSMEESDFLYQHKIYHLITIKIRPPNSCIESKAQQFVFMVSVWFFKCILLSRCYCFLSKCRYILKLYNSIT